jgi:hypothetical protein
VSHFSHDIFNLCHATMIPLLILMSSWQLYPFPLPHRLSPTQTTSVTLI